MLVPCPFCTKSPRGDLFMERHRRVPGCSVSCAGCGALGPSAPSMDEARHAWDLRLYRPGSSRVNLLCVLLGLSVMASGWLPAAAPFVHLFSASVAASIQTLALWRAFRQYRRASRS